MGFPTERDENKSSHLHRLARKLKILPVASLDMILSKKGIKKVLISLLRCAGWSAPLLFANPKDRFSCVKAHINDTNACLCRIKMIIFNI